MSSPLVFFAPSRLVDFATPVATGIREIVVTGSVVNGTFMADRDSLIMRTRALDRVLLWHHYLVPQYYSTDWWIAYWNKFGRPEKLAKYEPRGLDRWWIDSDKERALGNRQ